MFSNEIITLIYQFDPTFHEIMRTMVLPALRYEFYYTWDDKFYLRVNRHTGHHQRFDTRDNMMIEDFHLCMDPLKTHKRMVYFEGKIQQIIHYRGMKRHGESLVMYPGTSQVKSRLHYVEGKLHGLALYYFENGLVFNEGEYHHGKRCGILTLYHKDGKIRNQKEFVFTRK